MATDFTTAGTTVTESAQNPAWYQEGLADVLSQAGQVYDLYKNQSLTPYSGQVVAPTTALQQQAQQGTQAVVGGLGNYAQNMQQFMNPYQDQVVNQLATLGNRNLTENLLPQLQTQFGGAGQFGSKRMTDFMNRAVRDTQDTILQNQQNAMNTGWQNANQAMAQNFQQNLTGNQMLNQLGTEDWNRQQQQNAFNLQQWNTQQQAPWQTFGWLSNVVRGLQPGQVGGINYSLGGTSQPLSPSLSQQIGGLAAIGQSAVR